LAHAEAAEERGLGEEEGKGITPLKSSGLKEG